ncbi:glycoside hydrolase family 64 protein [Cucurbitaria berberidis CBS 394.84]|uniref:Glycoside hydrolase family 64 protein n=1 Tax=Cucurbitaria berberidis CBS 394.84 TaxID=1168544 RepID=A0A9P4GNV9_9PLEO|nr:glycoside hydrolase family 64 protein [Cucurbitaria berberidis CBS 394.84]KAF1848716.1 glycoside hydrolase family 64 protein [Cucurbitaria berberidis CBS 394.84]
MKSFKKLVNKGRESFQNRNAGEKDPTNTPANANVDNEKRVAAPQANDGQQQVLAEAAPGTLHVALQNKSSSSNVYAYITGLALEHNNSPIFVQSDGRSIYFPVAPKEILQPLQADVAIPLGAPGNTVNVNIPKIAGGRIWFSIDGKLTFLLNPGPAVVEPSVTNPSDKNFNIDWTFCEFTFNDAQLFANISYVDFINIPVSLSLTNTQGNTQKVPGMGSDGFQTVVKELRAQAQRDGKPWDRLIYELNGRPLRVLSPNNLLVGNDSVWGNYWDGYTQAVWNKFRNEDMTINTQAAAGNVTGRVQGNELQLGEAGSFSAPSAKDIFSCSTGPFATGSNPARNAVIPRLAAAFNRSTLLTSPGNQFPNGGNPSTYYKEETTNHYARIVHQVQRDGRGYAFPYDDVVPDGGSDVAGTLFDGSPKLFTVAVGGN